MRGWQLATCVVTTLVVTFGWFYLGIVVTDPGSATTADDHAMALNWLMAWCLPMAMGGWVGVLYVTTTFFERRNK